MKRILCLIVVLLTCITSAFSVTDFRPGYIVLNNNDTIQGFLDYRGNKANSESCIFKKEMNSPVEVFTPTLIKAYRFNNSKYFVSMFLEQDFSAKTLFVEYLFKGRLDVYSYFDGIVTHYLAGKDGKLFELKSGEKMIERDGKSYVVKNTEYMGILNFIFSDHPEASKLSKIELTSESLIKSARQYHLDLCSNDSCILFQKNVLKSKVSFGPLIGFHTLSYSIQDNSTGLLRYIDDSRLNQTFYPSIGFFVNSSLPQINDRLSLQYEVYYSANRITSQDKSPGNSNIVYVNDLKYTRQLVNNSLVVKYEIPKYKLHPTFNAGIFANIAVQSDYDHYMEVQLKTGEFYYTKKQSYENPFPNVDYGLRLGAGLAGRMLGNRLFFVDLSYQKRLEIMGKVGADDLSIKFGVALGN